MSGIITLLTDFGLADPYVGIMKGVILGINPKAVIVDISHAIEPQNIRQAAFIVNTAHRYFPQGTIHLVVVDPGVGSGRRAVILKTASAYFVAPDDGVLSYIIAFSNSRQAGGAGLELEELGPGLEAVAITNPRFWQHPPSSTFHGRDILAPVAAYLSLGIPISEFGEAIRSLLAFPPPRPYFAADGALVGHIVYIDRFGDLITDIGDDVVAKDVSIEVCGRLITGLSSCYAEGDELLALIGSSGNLEIAAKNRSAAEMLKAEIGDEVRIKRGQRGRC